MKKKTNKSVWCGVEWDAGMQGMVSFLAAMGVVMVLLTVHHCYNQPKPQPVPDDISKFIMEMEGFSAEPYLLDGVWHIGYGTVVASRVMQSVTVDKAALMLKNRLFEDRLRLSALIPEFNSFPPSVIKATHSAYYNTPALVGPFYRGYLSHSDWENASNELAWGHTPKQYYGLVVRRVKEANLIREDMGIPLLNTPASLEAFQQVKEEWCKHRDDIVPWSGPIQ